MSKLSVLVADDEEDIRILVQHWLTEAGYSVSCVASAREATALLDRQHFDLVVTDVLMPDGDGIQLIGRIKKAQPAVRVLAMSGGGRYMQSNNCLAIAKGVGAHGAVMKPFAQAVFMEAFNLVRSPDSAGSS